MVINKVIKCKICDTKYRLRWQVDKFETPVFIRCPKCNTKISGSFRSKPVFDLEINNAVLCDDNSEADFVQEISGVFLTHKLTPVSAFVDYCTPFTRSMSEVLLTRLRYISFIDSNRNIAEDVWSLFVSGQYSFLRKALNVENNYVISLCKNAIPNFCLDSKADLFMAGHQYVTTSLVISGIGDNLFDLSSKVYKLRKDKEKSIIIFSELMDCKGYFHDLNSKFPKLVGLFNKNYRSLLVPIITSDLSVVNLEGFGLSSTDPDDLLELYRKSYEFIGEFIIYVIGLNNIAERGMHELFYDGQYDIEKKVREQGKINRIRSFVIKGEPFSAGYGKLDNTIRNADSHFDIEYDSFTQKIRFTNIGKTKKHVEEMYLLELAQKTIEVFELVVQLWECSYQLQKYRMTCDLMIPFNYGRKQK